MPVSVTMPRLGESVTEGTVTRWLKAEGDQVSEDEPLLEVSTDKVDTEIPSPASGTLLKIVVAEDETVEIGTEIAIIGEAGETAQDEGTQGEATQAEAAPTPAPAPDPVPATLTSTSTSDTGESPVAAAPSPIPPSPIPPTPLPAFNAPAATFSPPAPSGSAQPHPLDAPSVFASAPAPTAPAPAVPATAGATDDGGTYLTPLVRKLAAEHGVDVSTVEGTGIGGRIRKSDVLAAAERNAASATAPSVAGGAAPTATAQSARGRIQKMSRRRTIIAARMVESMQTMAQLTTVVEVDVTKIAKLRSAAKGDFLAREGVPLSFLPFFTIATIEALKLHPILNASIDTDEETITFHDRENIGVAVDTEAGLTVPVIQHAGDLNLAGIARKIADLADRTRANKISPDELVGATFTITNTGSRGALFDTPIINQPQVAILGTGMVTKRAVVLEDADRGDTIAIRSMVYLALSYDHRIIDGADATRFLSTVKARLETGAFEGDLGL